MPPENENNPRPSTPPEIAPIHTYKSDVAEYIKKEGKTMADIAVAESQRTTGLLREEQNAPVRSKKALIILASVAVLIVVSGLFFLAAWLRHRNDTVSPYLNSIGNPKPIFVSGLEEKITNIGQSEGGTAKEIVRQALSGNTPFQIAYITQAGKNGSEVPVKSSEFFAKVDIYPPSDLLRTLKDQFALGSIAGKAKFLVLKTNYYPGAAASMLQWEPNMENDLRDLLDLPIPVMEQPALASGTPKAKYIFTDDVIDNRDARILKDMAGNTVLLYIFPDTETILLTGNQNAARIVPDKLLGAQK